MVENNPFRSKTVHGIKIGVLMLETGVERLPGDIGFAQTFDFPVLYKVVRGTNGANVIGSSIAPEVQRLFIDAAMELAELGADCIVTSCGFLALLQKEMVKSIHVPVATSSLVQIPLVQAMLPQGKVVGVLTMDEASLTRRHFENVGVDYEVPVVGVNPKGVFRTNHRNGIGKVSYEMHRNDLFDAADRLLREHDNIGAIVFECTNFPPYANAVKSRFGIPVFDVISLIRWLQRGLMAPRYA